MRELWEKGGGVIGGKGGGHCEGWRRFKIRARDNSVEQVEKETKTVINEQHEQTFRRTQ